MAAREHKGRTFQARTTPLSNHVPVLRTRWSQRLAEKAAERIRRVSATDEDINVRTTWVDVNETDIARETGEAFRRSVGVTRLGTVLFPGGS